MNNKMTIKMLTGIANAFDALLIPDFYIHTHQILASAFVKAVANKLAIYDDDADILWLIARMHDIGKLRILSTLHKCRNIKLERNSPEFEIIKTHSIAGEIFFKNMASPINGNIVLQKIAQGIRSHHEQWKGPGYPDGLSGYQIPLFSRVVTVLDSLVAMIGPERSYRTGMTLDEAIEEIKRGSGTQFDPQIVDVVLDVLSVHEKIV